MRSALVYLIGAGPGDSGLITVRGLECLTLADVVVHDHDVALAVLDQAQPDAERINIGARHAPQALAEKAISYLLADKAREGKVVARLMTGDPFTFALGGSEALFLREQGIPFEVVPGVPTGLGATAYAGVPASYPGASDAVVLLRGELDNRALPHVDWASLAKLEGTVICTASSSQLARVIDAMVKHGWPADGQAMVVFEATTPTQHTVGGSMSEVRTALSGSSRHGSAVLIAGRVVGLQEHLRWWDVRPLSGRRILVTRAREQAPELVDLLGALGAKAIEAPMIRIAPPEDIGPLRDAAAHVRQFDWIAFSSPNSVTTFMTALLDQARDIRGLAGPRLAVNGTGTAAELAEYKIVADLIPTEFRAEGLADALVAQPGIRGARVLLPRADIGRDRLAARLREAGAVVTEVIAYRTLAAEYSSATDPDVYGMLLKEELDAVTFTSASTLRNFVHTFGADQVVDLLSRTTVAVIGPVTAEAAAELGIAVDVQPATYTLRAMVQAIAAALGPR